MLNADEFYKYFHADWMAGNVDDGIMLSGRFMIFATDIDMTVIITENFTDHAAWVKRLDPLRSMSFLTYSGQLAVKFFYDKREDQTEQAIKDCKNMFIDV